MVVAPMSFDECNKRLIARDIFIDISEYISLTHTIAFNDSVSHRLSEIAGLISFMNEIMALHPHDFAISLASIERLGFFVSDTFSNHVRMMFRYQKNNLENERAFLKKNKLKEGIDFDMSKFRISGMDSDLDVEYKITTLAFYKLLNKKYDNMFLTLLNARVFQINSYYNKYISAYYNNKMNTLKNTIHGLTDDIGKLVIEHPQLKKSMVFNDVMGEVEESKSDDYGYIRDSYISNDSDAYRQSFNSQVKTPIFDQRLAMGSYNDNNNDKDNSNIKPNNNNSNNTITVKTINTIKNEINKVIQYCLEKLPVKLKGVFWSKYLEEKNTPDICKEFNISPSNYWVILHRSKVLLQNCIKKAGG